jgi:hypothetical protein
LGVVPAQENVVLEYLWNFGSSGLQV